MNFKWKDFSNWWKVFISLELMGTYLFLEVQKADFELMDLIWIGVFQFMIFFPLDAFVMIQSFRKAEKVVENMIAEKTEEPVQVPAKTVRRKKVGGQDVQ